MSKRPDARPFLKWAGGKTQLLSVLGDLIPSKMQTFFEPFLGGGSVLFHMSTPRRFQRAVVNDWNAELVNTYQVVRDSPEQLLRALSDHMAKEWNTKAYFDAMRAQLPADLSIIERAARFIYLNKTCFNGLHRVNKSGQFNVPFGDYKNPKLFDVSNVRRCSVVLGQDVTMSTGDFTRCIAEAGPGDVVYFDPPYVPLKATSNFASYTSDGYDIGDQQRLAHCFRALAEKGVTCILSNSDTEVVRVLYEGFEIVSVQAARNINSKGDSRGPVGEVIVVTKDITPRVSTLDQILCDEVDA